MDDDFGGISGRNRMENTYRNLFGEPEEKRTFGRHKRMRKDDIEVGFRIRMGKGGLYLSAIRWKEQRPLCKL
jgi:hypothetical protein